MVSLALPADERPLIAVPTGEPATLGDALPWIERAFHGAIGVVLVTAEALREVEPHYGAEAHQRALQNLVNLVGDAARPRLDSGDLVVQGPVGHAEVVLLCFRSANDITFQRGDLPELARLVSQSLAAQGHRVGHPYVRGQVSLPVGSGFVLRNPTLSVATQLRAALDEARADAELAGRVAARDRRQRLMSVLVGEEVVSVYEPIVEVTTRTVFGYEALARGPAGSELHSPAVMFERATEEGLVFELDSLCRRRGLEGALDLPSGTKLFLNFRPTTIHDPSFQAEVLSRTLAQSRLRPSDIVFEISEQESIDNFWLFREVRDYYGSLGFQIALDDTGAGYSSLEAVMELSPEFIKVDRAFVQGIDQDPSRQELLKALHAVANRIGSRIIAEGLDTLEELNTLGQLGIPFGQGWLFGKATPLRAAGQ